MINREMSQMQFSDLMQKLDKIIEEYERRNINQHIYTLFNSSGKTIKFKILKKNVAHLVGIESREKGLQTIANTTDMYEVMKKVVNNSFDIYTKGHNGAYNFNAAFSKYMEEKIDAFNSLFFLNIKNIKYVVCYDKTKSYGVIDDINNPFNCEYYIVLKTKDDSEAYLGLKYDEKERCYVASSLISGKDNARNLNYLLRNQTITIPNEIVNYDNTTGYKIQNHLYYSDKNDLYNDLHELISIYNVTVDLSYEWNVYLNKLMNYDSAISPANKVAKKISTAIVKGDILTDEMLDDANRILRQDSKILVRAYQSYTKSDIDESVKLKKELQLLKNKLLEAESLIAQKQKIIDEQNRQIEEQEKTNKVLSLLRTDVQAALDKTKTIG